MQVSASHHRVRFIKAELKSVQTKRDRKNPTSHNDTPNTPDVSESAIGRMKVAELRTRLARQGIDRTDGFKKPELVKKLVKSLTAKTSNKSGGKRTGG